MKRRVVITGLGAVTPLGCSVPETWEAVCAGRSGVAPITRFDSTLFDTKIAAELKTFDPLQYVNKKEYRRLDDFILYAIAASEMAVVDAGGAITGTNAERVGVIIGSAIGGLSTMEKEKETLAAAGPRRISTFAIPAVLCNLAEATSLSASAPRDRSPAP